VHFIRRKKNLIPDFTGPVVLLISFPSFLFVLLNKGFFFFATHKSGNFVNKEKGVSDN
jgi:hypothetical protein